MGDDLVGIGLHRLLRISIHVPRMGDDWQQQSWKNGAF